jgi:hypothetical protein
MILLFRRPCAADANTHYCNGEQLRIQRPAEGPLAGFTVVEVQEERTAQLLTTDGSGFQRYVPDQAEEEGEPAASPAPPAPPAPPATVDLSVLDGSLSDLEAALGSPAMTVELARALHDAESAEGGKHRKGALLMLDAYIAEGTPAAPSAE